MNWDVPPKWDTKQSVAATREHLEAYIDVLKREGKRGWVFVPARQLYTDCALTISETLFGRHLKELGVPKKYVKTGTLYAIFLGEE